MSMNSDLNLSTLPPDIIRQIISVADDLLPDVRSICPTWHNLVDEFITRTKLGTLERLYLFAGKSNVEDKKNVEDEVDEMEEEYVTARPPIPQLSSSAEKRLQMVAIVPKKHSRNVGVGHWLSIHQRYTGNAVEVSCSGQSSQPVDGPEAIEDKAMPEEEIPSKSAKEEPELLIGLIATLSILFLLCFSLIGLNLIGLLALIALFYYSTSHDDISESTPECAPEDEMEASMANLGELQSMLASFPEFANFPGFPPMFDRSSTPKIYAIPSISIDEPRFFPKIARMITTFSCIGNLVLENSRVFEDKDEGFSDAVETTLGDVRIDRLEITEQSLGEKQQNRIIELCRKHGTRQVFISASSLATSTFKSFASQLAHLDVTLDIYENSHSAHLVYFNKAPVFWNKIIEGLREENVSLRMITRHDDNFDRNHYNYQMRAHIRCEKADSPNAQQPMFPVDHTRGFNLSSCRAYY